MDGRARLRRVSSRRVARQQWRAVAAGAVVMIGIAACSSSAAPPVFHPAGAAASAGTDAGTPVRAATAPGGYRFPGGLSVQFSSPLPASGSHRAILAGYQNYVLALWAAVASHGSDTAYQQITSGNALTFAKREMRYYSGNRTIRGTIRYFDTTVQRVYFGHGAVVASCVDTSQFNTANAQTGAVMGSVFPAKYAHYLENVAEGLRPDGTWYIAQTLSYPASTTQGAMCQ